MPAVVAATVVAGAFAFHWPVAFVEAAKDVGERLQRSRVVIWRRHRACNEDQLERLLKSRREFAEGCSQAAFDAIASRRSAHFAADAEAESGELANRQRPNACDQFAIDHFDATLKHDVELLSVAQAGEAIEAGALRVDALCLRARGAAAGAAVLVLS